MFTWPRPAATPESGVGLNDVPGHTIALVEAFGDGTLRLRCECSAWESTRAGAFVAARQALDHVERMADGDAH